MRKGFSLLTAIIFLVLVATISVLALTISTQAAKQTTDIFLKNQAELLLRSGTEFAMLAMSGHEYNTTNGCLDSIDITYPDNSVNYTHEINVTIMYLGSGLDICANTLSNDVDTNESNRTVIIDTIVSTNPNLTPDTIPEQIRMHRRSIQKP